MIYNQKLSFSHFISFYNSKNSHLEFYNLSPQGLISSIIIGKQLIQDFNSLLTEQWPCSMVGMYVSKYLKEPRHALKVFELLSGSVKQISEKQVTEKQVSEKQVSEKEVSENENLDSEKQYQCSICDINFAYITHCKFL